MSLSPLSRGVMVDNAALRITVDPAPGRLSLRAREAAIPALEKALGLTLPADIAARTEEAGLEAAKLGPDEWVLLGDAARVAEAIAACAAVEAPHSLVDISGREDVLRIEGPAAPELLAFGCPRDIDQVGEGTCRRTLFDGATVTLWRDGPEAFRMDIWRSFAPHLAHLMKDAAKELAAEAAAA
ncbi:sarcosine oxidase subunit gamma [Rhodovulum sp. DZ06]|uniref:sarcosine oxidase subunit gamma n=1 Tax=Rhodovulum sp. DZ06 TaxID=3425126 RepID=UPI003D326B12